jgi:vanillate O-demethylase monooxygenase subunit
MTYLRDCWYMAAWADEVPSKGGLARTFLDEPVLLYRNKDGRVRALLDRCPHRFAPLSAGSFVGDVVTCGYHGLAFDGSGRCVANPHGPISRALRVRCYPVEEAHRAVWIWMGNPARADRAAIRDLSVLGDAPDSAYSEGYLHGAGHYELYVDNILDLSHADFLHPNTLGGGATSRVRGQVEERSDGSISVLWHSPEDVPTPLFRRFLPEGTEKVEAWTEVVWSAPGIMTLTASAVRAGDRPDGAGELQNVHIMTPETARSTHYFFASTRNFARDDSELNDNIAQFRAEIFMTEDEPMIAAQQARMGDQDFWSLSPALLRIDEGGVRVRRRMEKLIATERECVA